MTAGQHLHRDGKRVLLQGRIADAVLIAAAQRRILLAVRVELLVMPLPCLILLAIPQHQVLSVVLILHTGIFAIAFRALVAMNRLAGNRLSWTLVECLVAYVPLFGLLPMLLVVDRATTALAPLGVRAGFRGVPQEDLPKLFEQGCVRCGYDCTGVVVPQCPECGATIDVIREEHSGHAG